MFDRRVQEWLHAGKRDNLVESMLERRGKLAEPVVDGSGGLEE